MSVRAMNDFVPQTSTKKYSTTVSSNIIACRHELLNKMTQHGCKNALIYTDTGQYNKVLKPGSTDTERKLSTRQLYHHLSLNHCQHDTFSPVLLCVCVCVNWERPWDINNV